MNHEHSFVVYSMSHQPYAFSLMTNSATGDVPTELLAVTDTFTALLSGRGISLRTAIFRPESTSLSDLLT